jgi:hypothetical protein
LEPTIEASTKLRLVESEIAQPILVNGGIHVNQVALEEPLASKKG